MQAVLGSPSANLQPAPAAWGTRQHAIRASPELYDLKSSPEPPDLESSPDAAAAAPRGLDTSHFPRSKYHAGTLLTGQANAARSCLSELACQHHNIVAGQNITSASAPCEPAGPHEHSVLSLENSGTDHASLQSTDIAMQQAQGWLPGITSNGPLLHIQHSPVQHDPDRIMAVDMLPEQAHVQPQHAALTGLGQSIPHDAGQRSQVGLNAAEPDQRMVAVAAMRLTDQQHPDALATGPAPVDAADTMRFSTVAPSSSQDGHQHSESIHGAVEPDLCMSRDVALQLAAGMQQASSSIATLTAQLQAMQQLLTPFLQVHGLHLPPPKVADVPRSSWVTAIASSAGNAAAGKSAAAPSQKIAAVPTAASSAPQQPAMFEKGDAVVGLATVAQCSTFAAKDPDAAMPYHHDTDRLAGHQKRRRI